MAYFTLLIRWKYVDIAVFYVLAHIFILRIRLEGIFRLDVIVLLSWLYYVLSIIVTHWVWLIRYILNLFRLLRWCIAKFDQDYDKHS